MAKHTNVVAVAHDPGHGSLATYIIGFILSIYLTLVAYIAVTRHVWHNRTLLWLVAITALLQFFVQAFFFLHLGQETKPRWKIIVFVSMIGVVFILVFGSIWIMDNLNYHMMTPAEEKTYMRENEGL